MPLTPEELEQKIRDARAHEQQSEPTPDTPPSSGRQAAAAGMEFLSAVVVGALLGYLIDQWLDTRPWGMVIMFLLGSAAGFLNIYRTATGQDYKVGMGTLDTQDKNDNEDDKDKKITDLDTRR